MLKTLNMSENKIVELPSMHLQSVEKLYLFQNQIEIVEQFKFSVFPKMTLLDLRFNKIKGFPEMNLDSLITLMLDSN